MSEPRDYENGVADVLAFSLGDQAEVTRNEYLTGHLGGVLRQIDVVVRWRSNTERAHTLIVDCKRWAQKVDIRDVENLIGLMEDTRVDSGLLVTTNGASKAAFARARNAPAMRISLMSLDELKQWSPAGTVRVVYRINADRQAEAERALRNAGFRTVLTDSFPHRNEELLVEAFRHYGSKSPDGQVQSEVKGTKISVMPLIRSNAWHCAASSHHGRKDMGARTSVPRFLRSVAPRVGCNGDRNTRSLIIG